MVMLRAWQAPSTQSSPSPQSLEATQGTSVGAVVQALREISAQEKPKKQRSLETERGAEADEVNIDAPNN
jgi:hypothetical protein